MLEITSLSTKKLYSNKKLLSQVKKLTLNGWDSMMRQRLSAEQEGKAILAMKNDEIVGWCLLFKEWGDLEELTSFYYVKPKERRQGIGTALLKRAHYIAARNKSGLRCYMWDRTSTNFFRSQKIIKKEDHLVNWY